MCSVRTIHALQSNENKHVFEVAAHANFETVKTELSNRFNIPATNLKLIHAGHEIFDERDYQRLSGDLLTFHVVDRQRPATPADRPCPKPVTRPLVATKFLYSWCLLANIEECLRCIRLDPPNRLAKTRLSVAPNWTVFTNGKSMAAVPRVSDLGHLVMRIAGVFEQLSEECTKNAKLIHSMDSTYSPNQLVLRYVILDLLHDSSFF